MSDLADSKKDSKNCIMQAAARLFSSLGLDKCSTREIAKESDANISLISYYFGGKEGLYKEVLRNHALKIKERVQTMFDDMDEKPLTKELFVSNIEFMIDHMIQSHMESPEFSKILQREKLTGMKHVGEIHEEVFYPMIQKFYKLIRTAQDKGIVKKDIDPALFFVLISEAVFGFFTLIGCNTPVARDARPLLDDPIQLRNQIVKIYLTGALE